MCAPHLGVVGKEGVVLGVADCTDGLGQHGENLSHLSRLWPHELEDADVYVS